MGYDLVRFLHRVDDNLLCGVCSAVLEDAVLTPCGHSFCQLCLETWLSASAALGTCPQCRALLSRGEATPIHAIRSFIAALPIYCDQRTLGCQQKVTLDGVSSHLKECPFVPVLCHTCGDTLIRGEQENHRSVCQSVRVLNDPLKDEGSVPLSSDALSSFTLKMAALESRLKKTQRDLELAQEKNRFLEHELRRVRDEVRQKRQLQPDREIVCFDQEYNYGATLESVSQLAYFICRYLARKPRFIDADKVFGCIQRAYDNFGHDRDSLLMHMLLATASASQWFTPSQHLHLTCWLRTLTRKRLVTEDIRAIRDYDHNHHVL